LGHRNAWHVLDFIDGRKFKMDLNSGSGTLYKQYHVANMNVIYAALQMNNKSERSGENTGPNTRCKSTTWRSAITVLAEKKVLNPAHHTLGKKK